MSGSAEPIDILHVDDEPDFAEMAADFLERENERFAVETATSGEDGLERIEADGFDCIVSDYDMPGMTGIDLLEAVREHHEELPFILYTGKGSEEIASEAISAGVTDYLQKGSGTSQYEVLVNRIQNAVSRRQARQDATETERRLRTIAENTNDILWQFTGDWNELLFINSAYEEIWGQSVEELHANPRSFLDGIHADDRPLVEHAMEQLSNGEPIDIEFRVNDPEDFTRWVWTRGTPVFDEDGELEEVVGFVRDITERKHRELQLNRSEERYRRLLETSPSPVLITNSAAEIMYVNSSGRDFLGATSQEELIGRDVREFTVPDLREDIENRRRKLVEEGDEVPPMEQTILDLTGREKQAIVSSAPVTFEGESAIQTVVTDITERKERTRRLDTLVSNLPGIVYRCRNDPDWPMEYVRGECESLTGYPAEALEEGEVVWGEDILHPDDREQMWDAVQKALAEDRPFEVTYRIQTRDGDTKWMWERGQLFDSGSGDEPVLEGFITDITDREERERTLSQIVDRIGGLLNADTRSDVGQIAIDIVGNILDSPLAGVHLLSEDGEELESVAALDEVRDEFGVAPTYARRGDDAVSETVWDTFEAGETRYINDVGQYEDLTEDSPARSVVIRPLENHGVLIVSSPETDAFDETDRTHIELLGRTLTAALDRIKRESDLRQQTDQLERLHRAGQELIRAETPDEIASLIVESIEDILDHSITMVRYYDESEGGLVPIASTDATDDVFETRPVFGPDDGSLNWSAYASNSPSVYDDINNIDRAVDSETPIRSLMHLPLGDHGTVAIGDPRPHAFDESDVYRAQLLATTAELSLSRLDHEAELLRQRNELDRQIDRLDGFAGVVSHDLRNPLSVAEGRLELAREECDSEHLEAVTHAHERMAALIDDLLTLAREGDQHTDIELIDLAGLVETCWANVETKDATSSVETELSLQANRNRLQQLLENLIRNAVEHGGDDVCVSIGALENGFYVEDDGPGIPEDVRSKVLAPGYSTSESGTGFGLSIVRDIAEAHGWTIDITSSESGGARFEITGVEFGE